ncbi:Ig-like domain-containing protein [Methanobrevibacter sp.]|uniref:Ig-like domain-containing protein n=1 Tax=Methanobrevibacter sp. TaxID=66852 RepID=UPI00388E41AC
MKCKKTLIFICLTIFLFGVASVCATDVNQTVAADVETNPEVDLSNADKLTASADDSLKSSSDESDAVVLKGNKTATHIVVSDLNTHYKSGEYLYATLTDAENKPMGGEVLSVNFNGDDGYKVTDEKGQIRIDTFNLNVGTYDVYINYAADNNHDGSSAAVKITVNKADSVLSTVDTYSLNYGDTGDFKVGVIGATGITAKIDNMDIETNGLNITIPKLSAGTHKLVVTTIPDDSYNSVSKTIIITVNKAKASFGIKDVVMNYGDSSMMGVSSDYAIGFVAKIDGKEVNVDGGFISLSGLDAGNHTLTVTSIPDANHTSVTKEATITVNKLNSDISIKDLNIDYVSPISITLNYIGATGFTATVDGKSVEVIGDVIKIPKLDAGTYTLAVTTIPDANYNSVRKTATLTVNKVDPQFNVHDVTYEYGTQFNMTVDTTESTSFAAKIDGKSVEMDGSMIIFPKLSVGTHTLTVTSLNDVNHNALTKTAKITVDKARTNVVTSKLNATAGKKVNLTAGIGGFEKINEGVVAFFTGDTKIGEVNVKNGIAKLTYTPTKAGEYSILVVYEGTSSFSSSRSTFKLTVLDGSGSSSTTNHTGDKNTSIDFNGNAEIYVPYSDANVTMEVTLSNVNATGNVTLTINGKSYDFPVVNGVAKIVVPDLDSGKYPYTITYSGDGKYPSISKNGIIIKQSDEVEPKITASNVNALYSAGTIYTIKVYKDGKPVKSATVRISGKISKTLTATNGIARFKITQVPGTYKITITSLGKSVTRTITVKHIVTLKTVTVKKSAKSLVLQASLGKVSGKYLNKKTVTFKFNGKTYKAKTNSKGVAKVTIKSSVLKKLKAGKKITYQATYGKDTVKKTVKVKK